MNTLIDYGIDYITMTFAPEAMDTNSVWRAANDLLLGDEEYRNLAQPAVKLGYVGLKSGVLFVGSREGEIMVECSGSYSERVWDKLFDTRCNVARLDVQVTIRVEKEPEKHGDYCKGRAIAYNDLQPKVKQRKIRWIQDIDDGYTLYIGSRKSEYFIRVYNKAAESLDEFYEKCWRYEVQLKNRSAKQAATLLHSSHDLLEQNIIYLVSEFARERGLRMDIDTATTGIVVRPVRTVVSDISARIEWLRVQVRPTVIKLADMGYRDLLMEVLFGSCEKEGDRIPDSV